MKRATIALCLAATSLAAVSIFVGCGGGGSSVSLTVSQLITRVTGGTVTNGKATLTIPANSLPADTTITMAPGSGLPTPPSGFYVLPETVWALGPAGTALAPVGSVTVGYSGATIPSTVDPSTLALYEITGSSYTAATAPILNTGAKTATGQAGTLGQYVLLGTITGGTRHAPDYAGSWTGTWVNTTFGSTSNATLNVTVTPATKTLSMVFQINGNVLGTYNNPPAETYNGTYTDTAANVTATSSIFGQLQFSIDYTGHISGLANTTSNSRVSQVQFSGESSGTSITMNYKVLFRDGTSANGTFNFQRPAPR